jgi:hypothetical protein
MSGDSSAPRRGAEPAPTELGLTRRCCGLAALAAELSRYAEGRTRRYSRRLREAPGESGWALRGFDIGKAAVTGLPRCVTYLRSSSTDARGLQRGSGRDVPQRVKRGFETCRRKRPVRAEGFERSFQTIMALRSVLGVVRRASPNPQNPRHNISLQRTRYARR